MTDENTTVETTPEIPEAVDSVMDENLENVETPPVDENPEAVDSVMDENLENVETPPVDENPEAVDPTVDDVAVEVNDVQAGCIRVILNENTGSNCSASINGKAHTYLTGVSVDMPMNVYRVLQDYGSVKEVVLMGPDKESKDD